MEAAASYVADLRNLLSESSLAGGKSFIKSFIKEVKVLRTEAGLIYAILVLPKGVSQDTVGVSSIVRYGG